MGTLFGLLAAVALVVGAIISGGSLGAFFDLSSLVIVLGGTLLVVIARHPFDEFIAHFRALIRAFGRPVHRIESLVDILVELGQLSRSQGMLALEARALATEDHFLKQGLTLLADGVGELQLTQRLRLEMAAMERRHGAVISVWQGWCDVAPAMGMIGTLVGLVQMLGNMSDPQSIGPAMALALLTTLYGAFLAYILVGPIVNKLKVNHSEEMIYREAVLLGLQMIARNESPRAIGQVLAAWLPPHLMGILQNLPVPIEILATTKQSSNVPRP